MMVIPPSDVRLLLLIFIKLLVVLSRFDVDLMLGLRLRWLKWAGENA